MNAGAIEDMVFIPEMWVETTQSSGAGSQTLVLARRLPASNAGLCLTCLTSVAFY